MPATYSDSNQTIYASFAREQEIKRQLKLRRQQDFLFQPDDDFQYIGHDLDMELDKITAGWEV